MVRLVNRMMRHTVGAGQPFRRTVIPEHAEAPPTEGWIGGRGPGWGSGDVAEERLAVRIGQTARDDPGVRLVQLDASGLHALITSRQQGST